MVFRRLDDEAKAEFENAASEMFAAQVANGQMLIDLALWHPVFLQRLADELAGYAGERMSLATAAE